MWPIHYHVLAPMTYLFSGPKDGKLLCNYKLEAAFKYIKYMVSSDTLLNYPDWKNMLTVHTDYSDKQLVTVISQNNKPIVFYLGD